MAFIRFILAGISLSIGWWAGVMLFAGLVVGGWYLASMLSNGAVGFNPPVELLLECLLIMPALWLASILYHLLQPIQRTIRKLIPNVACTEVKEHEVLQLLNGLKNRARLSRVPRLYLVESDTPIAFSLANIHRQAIVLSTGLVQAAAREHLEWVLAIEMVRLRNGDSSTSTYWFNTARMMDMMDRSFTRIYNLLFGGQVMSMYTVLAITVLVSPLLLFLRIMRLMRRPIVAMYNLFDEKIRDDFRESTLRQVSRWIPKSESPTFRLQMNGLGMPYNSQLIL